MLEVCRVHDALIILAMDLNCHGFCESDRYVVLVQELSQGWYLGCGEVQNVDPGMFHYLFTDVGFEL